MMGTITIDNHGNSPMPIEQPPSSMTVVNCISLVMCPTPEPATAACLEIAQQIAQSLKMLRNTLDAQIFPDSGKIWAVCWDIEKKMGGFVEKPPKFGRGGRYRTRTCDPYHVKGNKPFHVTILFCTTYGKIEAL